MSSFKRPDAEEFIEALNDPRIFEHLPEAVPELADIVKLIDGFIERDNRNSPQEFHGINLTTFHRQSNAIMGWCDPYPDKLEIFYGLNPRYWEKG